MPVGEDQVPYIEFMREITVDSITSTGVSWASKPRLAAVKKLEPSAKLYRMRTKFLEQGDAEALGAARALLEKAQNLALGDRERLFGFLEGGGKVILTEPQALLTEASKMPGLDGQKMSKSYNNTIGLRDDDDSVAKKIRTMPTDPARVKRTDPGDPDKCPVWQLHLIYSDEQRREWVQQGCRSAGIGVWSASSR